MHCTNATTTNQLKVTPPAGVRDDLLNERRVRLGEGKFREPIALDPSHLLARQSFRLAGVDAAEQRGQPDMDGRVVEIDRIECADDPR